MIATLFIALFVLLFLGTPVFVALGLSAVLALVGFSDLPLMGVAQRLINGVDKFSLLAVPFFIFAANVMKNGGIAKRIMNWAKTMVGSSRGSLAVTTEVSCMFFGAVSGSSPATVVAMGSMMYPELIKEKYPKRFSLGLITAAGSVAILIPPSINMIVYGTVTGASVGALFIGGIGAGLIYGLAYIVYCLWYAKKYNIPKGKKSTGREKWAATKDAAWALGVPVIIMGGIYSGVCTPTEASGVSALYAIIISMLVYREMDLKQLWKTCIDSVKACAQVMVMLATASIFSWVLTVGQVPQTVATLIAEANFSPFMFLMMVNVLFLIAGMFIDGSSATIILAPLLYPVAESLGIDLVHFGVMMVANIAIGMFSPPFGLNLFVAQPVTGAKMKDIIVGVFPYLAISLIALIVITYVPQITLFIPRLVYGG